MYNSRPRYTRYDNYPQTVKVPKNYSGNAFGDSFLRENTEPQDVIDRMNDKKDLPEENTLKETDCKKDASETLEAEREIEECSVAPKKKSLFGNVGFGFDLSKLFGGFGFEELLILGLIFLMMQNEGNEDIILLLILLFFIN